MKPTDYEERAMSDSVLGSISVELSKKFGDEELFDHLLDESGVSADDDRISNEAITKGISISKTYKVLSDPIKGGMGSVWKVHHNGWNLDLAMKRPLPKFFAEASERRKENFIRECEEWINLGLHPNIVSCYYVREVGGVPTIFSEWMENGSLESRIRDKALYAGTEKAVKERLLDISIQFARGLHYAHESGNGLIHQDVKPDNLLLALGWDAKVADFGLARARTKLVEDTISQGESAQGVDHDGASMPAKAKSAQGTGEAAVAPSGYTQAYGSYEQFAGQPVSRQTDIYSWAVSVLEMYMGSRPWKSGTEAGRKYREYLESESFQVKMPEEMEELIGQCLAEDPNERPRDFGIIIGKLVKIYRETTGTDYPRPEPDAAPDTADSLNNRALSYLDLGKSGEAGDLWEEALKKDASQADAVFNRALFLRRGGRISYNEAEDLLVSIGDERIRKDDLKALREERRILDLDIGDFSAFKGKNFSCFSEARSRGAGLMAVRGRTSAINATHIVVDMKNGRTIFEDPAEARDYRNERTLLTKDGKYILVNRYGERYRKAGPYGEDAFYEVDSGKELWRRQNQGEMFMLSPDDRFAVGNRIIKTPGEYNKVEVVVIGLESGEVLRVLEGQGGLVGFTPEGRMLLGGKIYTAYLDTVGRDESLTLGGLPDDSMPFELVRFEGVVGRGLSDRCWLPMKNGLAVFCGDTAVKILDPSTGTTVGTYELGEGSYGKLNFAALLDEERLLLGIWTYRGEQTALIWEIGAGKDAGTGELLDSRALGKIMDPRNIAWMIRSSGPVILRPSIPADYKLSVARGLRDREETDKQYRELLRRAREVFDAGDPIRAIRLADEAAEQPGYYGMDEPLREREYFGKGLEKKEVLRLQMTEEAAEERIRRPLPSEEDAKRFAEGIKEIQRRLYKEHESDIDTEVYVYTKLGEYCADRSKIVVHTELIEDDISPFRPKSASYAWYGAGVLDAESGEVVYLNGDLYYRGETETHSEWAHNVVLDRSGSRLLEYDAGLRVREISDNSATSGVEEMVKELGSTATSGVEETIKGISSTATSGVEEKMKEKVKELGTGEFLYADFLDDDRYVLCMDSNHCARVIDTNTGRVMIEQAYPESEYGTLYCLEGESFGIPHYGRGFLCRIIWEYNKKADPVRPLNSAGRKSDTSGAKPNPVNPPEQKNEKPKEKKGWFSFFWRKK